MLRFNFLSTDNIYILPCIISENRHWERCPRRLRVSHSKLSHVHYTTREHPPSCEDCGEYTPLTISHVLTECPQLNNRRRRFFGTTNKTMKQFFIDGDTSCGGTLYKFSTDRELLTTLQTTDENTLNNYNGKKNKSRST